MKEMLNRIKYFIIGILVFLLYFKGLPIILGVMFGPSFKSSSKFVSNIYLSLAEIIIFLVLFMIFRKTIVSDIKKFKHDYKKNLDTGFKYYFIGFLVMVASNLLLNIISGGMATNESVNREYLKMYPLYSIVAMVFIGPLVEEIVFRLGFRKAFKKCLTYCLFSGIFFGALHVYTAYEGMNLAQIAKNWFQILYIVPYSSLGVAFAKSYYETDNICTTMVIHTIHNALTVFLILLVM